MVSFKDIPENQNLSWPESWLTKIAKPFSWIFISLGIHGSAVTFLSIFFGIIGATVAASGNILTGFLLFCVYVLLDNSDGQVSRYFKDSKEAGVYIDSRTHFIVEPLFFIGMGVGTALKLVYSYNPFIRSYYEWWPTEALAGAFIVAGLLSALFYLMRQTMKIGDLGYPESGARKLEKERSLFGKIHYLIFNTIRINNPFGLMLWAIIFNLAGFALIIYAILFAANTLYSFIKNWTSLEKKHNENINDRPDSAS